MTSQQYRHFMKKSIVKDRLNELYPNKVIEDLNKPNKYYKERSLYQIIFQKSKRLNMTMKDYLYRWGFEYRPSDLSEQEVIEYLKENYSDLPIKFNQLPPHVLTSIQKHAKKKKMFPKEYVVFLGFQHCTLDKQKIRELLMRIYPDGQVRHLYKNLGNVIYNKINMLAKKEEMTVKDFILKELGMTESKGTKKVAKLNEEFVIQYLSENYPNKVIERFKKSEASILNFISSMAKANGMNKKNYLQQFGFQYLARENKDSIEIIILLKKLYPNHIITNIYSHRTLYSRIRRQAKNENMKTADWLSQFGFKYKRVWGKNTV